MGLNLDPQCQAAIDLAKRTLADGDELDTGTLLAALYHQGNLQSHYPKLATYLPEPVPRRREAPAKVSLAAGVRPVFQQLANTEKPVSVQDLFQVLLSSEEARQYLRQRGLPEQELAQSAADAAPQRSAWQTSPGRQAAIQALNSYGRILTDGDPPKGQMVECEAPLKALLRTLSKFRRRNAIIVGLPGTGKSAVIYELARRLHRGDRSIPPKLRDMDLFELSPVFLKSGASAVGQYEERVKGLLQVLAANPKIILFIDEIHSMFQSGVHDRGPWSDANESFKGALGRGETTCIGCTTPVEYRHHIEPDRALERRFTVIRLDPPAREATIKILQARRPRMEAYFVPLRIPDTILERAVDLTDEYLPGRYQPDKAIQLLDEACACCATTEPPPAVVTEAALVEALEDIIGHGVMRKELVTEQEVLRQLQTSIVGQDQALGQIARAFVAGLSDWARHSGPRAVFLFGGPTGVGKTETDVQLAKVLGAGKSSLVRVDCNTFQGSWHDGEPAINRLLGVPPGYVGYARGQGGLLSRVRDLPESVILFDEFEKAGPPVWKLVLQIIDDGRVEDTEGNPLNFRRSFIVFTTNAGCTYDQTQIGFEAAEPSTADIPQANVESLKRDLRTLGLGEEFFARVTHFVIFRGLDRQAIEVILARQLRDLAETSREKGLELGWADGLVPHLAAAWQPRFGVRFATTILRHRIEEQLAVADAQGDLRSVRRIWLEPLESDRKNGPQKHELAGLAVSRRDGDRLVISLA